MKVDPFADFEDEARKLSRRPSGCGVGKLLTLLESDSAVSELKGDMAVPLRKALANPSLTSTAIVAVLKKRLDVSWEIPRFESVQRHRNGSCKCEQGG